jgi:hypothetical protein
MIIFTSLSYPLLAVTTDNGRVLAIFIISGWKSILSCRFGARLILMTQIIICFSTSAPNDNLMYFLLLSFVLSA